MQASGIMKKALVTGGGRGIGAAICRALARDGWFVYVGYGHSREAAEALAAEIGGEALLCDVSDTASVREAFARAGGVELLVNNAGVAWYGLLQDMTEEQWRTLFATNTDGMYRTCREAIPPMVREHRGSIVNLTSVWGVRGGSCEAAYSASKGAVIALTKALAKELGPAGIRVNAVAPGVIDTAMIGNLDEETRAALAEDTPLGRLGQGEDVAEAVAFLASGKASFITGQVLGVDGGFGV